MSDLWDNATRDIEREHNLRTMTEARAANAETWHFLAQAVSERDFENRLALVRSKITAPEGVQDALIEGWRATAAQVREARKTAGQFRRVDRSYVRDDGDGNDGIHVAGPDDQSPQHLQGRDGYNPDCSWCYLNAPHSQEAHKQSAEQNKGLSDQELAGYPQGVRGSRKQADSWPEDGSEYHAGRIKGNATLEQVQAYLYDNFKAVEQDGVIFVSGWDRAGFTWQALKDRLLSGLIGLEDVSSEGQGQTWASRKQAVNFEVPLPGISQAPGWTRAEETVVAIAYDPETGQEYDRAFNWETGQQLARSNYKVIAVAPSGHMSIEEAQDLYDYERRLAQDCWGLSDTQTIEASRKTAAKWSIVDSAHPIETCEVCKSCADEALRMGPVSGAYEWTEERAGGESHYATASPYGHTGARKKANGMKGVCSECGNPVTWMYDATGQRGEAWHEDDWPGDQGFQCRLSEDGLHHSEGGDKYASKDPDLAYFANLMALASEPIADDSGQGVSSLPADPGNPPDGDAAFSDFGWAADIADAVPETEEPPLVKGEDGKYHYQASMGARRQAALAKAAKVNCYNCGIRGKTAPSVTTRAVDVPGNQKPLWPLCEDCDKSLPKPKTGSRHPFAREAGGWDTSNWGYQEWAEYGGGALDDPNVPMAGDTGGPDYSYNHGYPEEDYVEPGRSDYVNPPYGNFEEGGPGDYGPAERMTHQVDALTAADFPHVHPETYSRSDDDQWRGTEIHYDKDDCAMSFCTYADETDSAKARDRQLAQEDPLTRKASKTAGHNPYAENRAYTYINPSETGRMTGIACTEPGCDWKLEDGGGESTLNLIYAWTAHAQAERAKENNYQRPVARRVQANDPFSPQGNPFMPGGNDQATTPDFAQPSTDAMPGGMQPEVVSGPAETTKPRGAAAPATARRAR